MRRRAVQLALALAVAVALTLGMALLSPSYQMTRRIRYDSDASPLLNPERGWMIGNRGDDPRAGSLRLDDSDRPDSYTEIGRRARLAYAGVRLDQFGAAGRDFRTSDLDEAALTALQVGFDRVRAGGFKVILRFTYNTPENFPASIDEDASEERIIGHIRQLAPLLERNADVIALVQAGFIGAWGEWHNSTNCLTADLGDLQAVAERCVGRQAQAVPARRRILDALLAAVPRERAIAVRQPRFRVEQIGGLPAAARRFSGAPEARIGLHDDCLLADPSDMGTFSAPFPDALLPRPEKAGDIAAWRAYAARETLVVPFGGETCPPEDHGGKGAAPCAEAQRHLRELHTTFLNSSFHLPTLDAWKRDGCYDEIGRNLGYRLELVDARWSESARSGHPFRLEFKLRNRGWAGPINARPLYLVIDDGGHAFIARVSDDLRPLLGPGKTQRFDVRLALPPSVVPGSYQMFLWLPDPAPALARRAEYSIRLANIGLWNDQGRVAGMNLLTTAEQRLVVEDRGRARDDNPPDTILLRPLEDGVAPP
jgi:hypothetical protein